MAYEGKTSRAHAVLVEDPDQVADTYAAVIGRLGWKEHLSLIRLQPEPT